MSNPYSEAVASHKVSDLRDPETNRVLCTCGKPMSHRHVAAVGHAATRRAARQAAQQ